MVENVRTIQDHIRYLEGYITEITKQIDEITQGRELEKEIASIEYRIEVLSRANGAFTGRIAELEEELGKLRKEFKKIQPEVERLEQERAFYRKAQTDLAGQGHS